MPDLDTAIGLVLADFPGPAARRLMTDCWALGQKHGESEGLKFLEMYRRAFERYERERHEFEVRSRMPGYTAGERDPGYTEEVDG